MATAGSTTPASTGASPPPLALAPAPALATRPSASASPGPGTPGSITSKEWVIPPRPKPGRKPAMDTPPTKRKAQNRAAQRAFRERRAARVGELEEQMKEIEDGHEVRVATLNEKITNLSRELEQCREEVSWWRNRCHGLEKEVSIERSAKEALVKEFRSSLSGTKSNTTSTTPGSVPLPPHSRPATRSSQPQDVAPSNADRNNQDGQENVPLGCNNCSSTHCQCIEDAFAMPVDAPESSGTSHPPTGVSNPQRENAKANVKPESDEMEVDFTSQFATPSQTNSGSSKNKNNTNTNTNNNNDVSPSVDPCGFCQDGTPCICAEMAAQEQPRGRPTSFENNRLAPIQSLSQFTPPPSDGDLRSELTLPPISQATNPCVNGPGTCAQCLADPRSTLFCKTLAASQPASGTPAGGGCCGGKPADGGCCMSRNAPITTTNTNPPNPGLLPPPTPASTANSSSPSLTLTCADAFTTLSRHPNFSRASDEISTWLPQLHTLPNPRDLPVTGGRSGRAAMEIEAASVMGVLRYFDRRFTEK